MPNPLNKLTAAFLEGIVHYAFGCICYNQMGISPIESDALTRSRLTPTPAAELDENSAENRTNQIDTPSNRTWPTRTD